MIFIGIAFLLLSFPLYYYVVKVKGATQKSWRYFAFTATNIGGCIWTSNELIILFGGVNEDLTWWDLASFGIMIILHLTSIVIAQLLWGAPQEENIPSREKNN